MKPSRIILVLVASFLLMATALAQDSPPMPSGGMNESNYSSPMQPSGSFDLGIPQQSFASPEYVAQEKMIESMTTAYNWIALNSARFAEGCREDRPSLVSEITAMLGKAQETSTVCENFAAEVKDCDPEKICARFKEGKLPLAPNASSILAKLGYDAESLTVEDLTQELMVKVCLEQRKENMSERYSMLESVKEKIQSQLPAFREKCGLLKQAKGNVPEVMLPNIDIRPQVTNQVMQQYNQPQGMQPMQGEGCREPHPDCYPMKGPYCKNGNWVCEGAQQQPQMQACGPGMQPEGNSCVPSNPGPAPCPEGTHAENNACVQNIPQAPANPMPPQCGPDQHLEGNNCVANSPQPAPPQEPVPAQPQEPAPEPEPSPATGAAIMGENYTAVCGNRICEPDFGESYMNCHDDCQPETGISGSSGGGYGQQAPQQYSQQAQVQNFVMPGPEQLCGMSDEEIVDMYSNQMGGGIPKDEELEYECTSQAGKDLSNMNRYKLEIARCTADAALDCEAKKQALASCKEMKSNPEKVSSMIVNSMCRRFGVQGSANAESELYKVAEKWTSSDPALANQLGDTADQVYTEKESLDVVSHLFGNSEYAGNLEDKASELRAVRQRLVSNGVQDQETLNALDSQAQEFEKESQRYSNLFDFSRLGEMFK